MRGHNVGSKSEQHVFASFIFGHRSFLESEQSDVFPHSE
jgi:hypothetical protein